MPTPISVNMLSRRVLSEVHARWKSGRPAQATTGVASASSTQASQLPNACCTGMPGIRSLMASRKTGTLKSRLTRKRRIMSSNSGLLSSALRETGSSAMPQIGQSPGSRDRTSGCMGHVYSSACFAGADFRGSRYRGGSASNFVRQLALQKP